MADHLLDRVRPYLDRGLDDRIAYIRAPRWIGHRDATQALERLNELLCRPPGLRTRGLMLVGPYANGKTMIVERFAVAHLKACEKQRVWVVQTREGAGLAHFYASILSAFRAPTGNSRDVGRKAEQVDRLLDGLEPRILIFDEFHNALRGRARDVEAVLAFLRRIGRQFDISPVLIGEVAVYDFINATDEMASRFELIAAPRWRYDDEFLTLLDSLESALPLARRSDLSEEKLAREIFRLSEGLIGEIVAIVTAAAIAAARSGAERITRASIEELDYIPVSRRRGARPREALLGARTGVAPMTISTMALTDRALSPLWLPLRQTAHRRRSTWLQYCALCLADDRAPYFRRSWRLASRISCFRHGCGLRDRCPACRGGLAPFAQTDLIPQHVCAHCGFDMRGGARITVEAGARRLERSIDDLCQAQIAKRLSATSVWVARLTRIPDIVGLESGRSLVDLSASARVRCFERLAQRGDDGSAVARARPRRPTQTAGGRNGLIRRFVELVDARQGSPRSAWARPPDVDLAALLAAYVGAVGRGSRSKRRGADVSAREILAA